MSARALDTSHSAPAVPGAVGGAIGVQKLDELESVRGIAALMVVFFHLPPWQAWLGAPLFRNSYLMVDLFFVLSGFVMFRAYGQRIDSKSSFGRFLFLRLGRLYPVHLVFLVAFIVYEVARAASGAGAAGQGHALDAEFGVTVVQNLFLVQALGPMGHPEALNGPAWSISVEFYTYVLFALLTWMARSWEARLHGLIVLLGVMLMLGHGGAGYQDLIRCLTGFFAGCLTARWVGRARDVGPRLLSLLILLGLVGFLQFKGKSLPDVFVLPLSVALVASLVVQREGLLNRILRQRVLVWLGTVSYSLYMSHLFVIYMVTFVYKKALGLQETAVAGGAPVLNLTGMQSVQLVVLILVTVLVVSQASYAWIELPWRLRSRKRVGVAA